MSVKEPRMLPELRPGIYRHYKGPLYQALGYGHDANDATRVVVVYMPLQLDGAHEGPRLAVRSVYGDEDCWHDMVHRADGSRCESECHDAVPRFEWLGYEFRAVYADLSQDKS
jgi:hypothetical protein